MKEETNHAEESQIKNQKMKQNAEEAEKLKPILHTKVTKKNKKIESLNDIIQSMNHSNKVALRIKEVTIRRIDTEDDKMNSNIANVANE